MKLTGDEVEKIAQKIIERLKEKELIVFKVEEHKVLERAITAINSDLRAEENLDREVETMLKEHTAEIDSGRLDYRKMFSMIKNKLARERGIVL